MAYLWTLGLSVFVFVLIRQGWFSLARHYFWKRSLDRLDKLEWTRVVAELRASGQD